MVGGSTDQLAIAPESDGHGGRYANASNGNNDDFAGPSAVFPFPARRYESWEMGYKDTIYYFAGTTGGALYATGWET